MRRVATNRVYFSPTTIYRNHILEIYGEMMINHFKLEDELELTEWLGGIIMITDEKTAHTLVEATLYKTFTPSHINDILQFIYPSDTDEKFNIRRTALHISGIDISTGKIISKITPTILSENTRHE